MESFCPARGSVLRRLNTPVDTKGFATVLMCRRFVKHRVVIGDDGSQRFHGEDISLLSEEQVKDLNLETGQGVSDGQI
jgi:hypothetical protein